MEELHKDIKKRVHACYFRIKQAEEELKRIREKECAHLETEICDFEWGPGHITPNTKICSICGEVLPNASNTVDDFDVKIGSWSDGGCSTGLNDD